MPDLIIDEDDFRRAVKIVWENTHGGPITDDDRLLIDAIAREIMTTRARTLAPFERLFAGDPDTACRTTWRHGPTIGHSAESIECVEVPMDELRAAFDEAKNGR